ncbi:hypothetical protein [Hyphobacterium marinum]|uniref:Prolipoprotein diacylglyceryl transferase n=1 Tax=Hyphobacterium marinum TaxID=3116574 RepID=A0ABU7LUM5_9PROT|nr:hypothetical protein [Hyphobacterium sp. Y6023]MEE2565256.1 hypothetical protein [Hyphobacterium sp. Y6023]
MTFDIEHAGPFLAFTGAAFIAALFGFWHLWQRHRQGDSAVRLAVPILAGLVLAVIAGLSIWHNRNGEVLGFLFGSETRDVGLSEYGVVVLLAGCAVLFGVTGSREAGWNRLPFAAAAAACLVIAGEELSWGQWIFHWDTPDALAAVNLQNETNAHNLVDPRIYDLIYSVIGFGILFAAGLAYVGFRRAPAADQWFPVRMLSTAGRWLRDSRSGLVLTLSAGVLLQHELFEEYSEFVVAFAAFLFLLHLESGSRTRSSSHGTVAHA